MLRIDISLLMSNEEIASNIEVFFDWRVYLEVPILKNWFSLAEALFEMRVDSIVFSASPSSRVDWPALGWEDVSSSLSWNTEFVVYDMATPIVFISSTF